MSLVGGGRVAVRVRGNGEGNWVTHRWRRGPGTCEDPGQGGGNDKLGEFVRRGRWLQRKSRSRLRKEPLKGGD